MSLWQPFRFRWSLRNKIITWSFVPTALILLAVALTTFIAYQQVTETLVLGRNSEVARLAADQIANQLTEYADLLTSVGRTTDIRGEGTHAQQAALDAARNRLVVFDAGVVLLNNQGIVVASMPLRSDIFSADWRNRSYFSQMLRAPAPAYSSIVTDGPDGAEVIVVAVPLFGDQGEFRGVLAGQFRLGASSISAFYGGIVKLRLDDGGTTYLVDGAGRVIYHSDPERVGAYLRTQPAVQQVLLRQSGDLRTRDLNGQDIVASYAPVPGTPWGLVTEESWAALMSSSQRWRLFLIALLALGVIVPALVVTSQVGRITGPIDKLIAGARAVAGGEFGHTIDVRTKDELESLGQQFNLMSAQLASSYTRLEERVAARTRELATLNEISAVVSRSLDLDEILTAALDKCIAAMGFDFGGAFRAEPDGQHLVLRAYRGLSDGFAEAAARQPVAGSTAEEAAGAKQPVVSLVSEYRNPELKKLLEAEGLHLSVAVPLVVKGRLGGSLHLGSRTPRTLTADELALLSAIGHQVALAVENAYLYEQAEQSAAAAERNRLARDLHDAVSQTLFSASLIAEVLPELWQNDPEDGMRSLQDLRQLTRGALSEMRMLLLELRPAVLTQAKLPDLLRHLAEATTSRGSLPVTLRTQGELPLPPDVQIALYRIAQEALNNITKHADATAVQMSLIASPPGAVGDTPEEEQDERGRIVLFVADNGRGFDPENIPPEHFGVGIMRERAQAAGARLELNSEPGHGTQVTVTWPDTTRMERE